MSDTNPGVPAPEYLEAGGGSPLPPEAPAPPAGGGGRRRGLLIGGGVAALAVVGVGAWAAAQFFSTGPQPAEALPASTIGYASIDLDPSGAQKIEALKTLNKFPAFKDELDLDADDDIRKAIFEELDLPEDCKLFYDKDIAPWLGDRMAVAAVDLGDDDPVIAGVVQVKDADAADAGLAKIRACGAGEGDDEGGWVIDGGWAIVADTEAQAQAVVDATDDGTLADDPEFKELSAAAGSAGIVSMYAAPEAGTYFEESLNDVAGLAGELEQGLTGSDSVDELSDAAPSQTSLFKDFKGVAVTVRFDDGALEIEGAGGFGGEMASAMGATTRGADVVETLPPATAVAFGMGFEEGWLTKLVESAAKAQGDGTTADDIFAEASEATGLDLPQDVEILLGRSAAIAIGSDFDPEVFFNSESPTNVPIALKVQGDPEAAAAVVTRLRDQMPPDVAKYIGLDSDGDIFVIGPDTEYRTALVGKGDLGNNEVYRDVIRESDKASSVLYVNFNAGDDWLVNLVGDDQTVADNVRPLAGLGVAYWQDDNWTHGVLRITTD